MYEALTMSTKKKTQSFRQNPFCRTYWWPLLKIVNAFFFDKLSLKCLFLYFQHIFFFGTFDAIFERGKNTQLIFIAFFFESKHLDDDIKNIHTQKNKQTM